MDTVLTKLQDLVSGKRESVREIESRETEARTVAKNAGDLIAKVDLELEQLAEEQARISPQWSEHALSRQLSVVPDAGKAAWLLQRQDAMRSALDAVQKQEALQRALLQRKESVQTQVNISSSALTQAVARLTELESRLQLNTHALATARKHQCDVADELKAQQDQLDSAFADPSWRTQWQQDSLAFVAECRSKVAAWNAQRERVEQLNNALAAYKVEIDERTQACLHANDQLQSLTTVLQAAEAEMLDHRTRRAALIGGRDVQEMESTLNAAIDRARKHQAQVQTALDAAQNALTREATTFDQVEQLLHQSRAALGDVQHQLKTWLDDLNARTTEAAQTATDQKSNANGASALTTQVLDALMQCESAWVLAEREALQQLEQAVVSAQAVLATRVQSRTEHAAQGEGIDTMESLKEALDQLQLAMKDLNDALTALKLELAKDDERVATSAELRQAFAQQEAVHALWARLSELIGSADGKKFRNFAQQLTLDILLSYGNLHLQNLARRYRLQRINDSLGLLVVDQDMGDEVRSVHSLSGGESFLVSLALALGLASLSSHRVQVESLFIDEGFGSLDTDALGVAMDALDNLQSQGRKVGVISHVQEMTERIGTRVQVQRQAGGLSRISVR